MRLKDLRATLDIYDDRDRVEVTASPIIEAIEAEIEHARAMVDVYTEVTTLLEEMNWEVTDSEGSVEPNRVARTIADVIEEQLTRYIGKGTEWVEEETSEFTVEMVSAGVIHIGPEVA